LALRVGSASISPSFGQQLASAVAHALGRLVDVARDLFRTRV
jgi:hypothetical protein